MEKKDKLFSYPIAIATELWYNTWRFQGKESWRKDKDNKRSKAVKKIEREDAKKIADEVRKSDFYKKFAYGGTWVSGSSTVVYPITVWENDIEIQLGYRKSFKGRSESFRRLMRKLKKDYPTLTGRLVKYDGSCPDTYVIYFN